MNHECSGSIPVQRGARAVLIAAAAGIILLGMSFLPGAPATAADGKCEPAALATKYPLLVGKTIRIGQSPTNPPYVFMESETSEKHIGFDADLARATFACLGVPIEFKAGKMAGLLPALVAGQIDIMWTNFYYTPARAEQVDFVTYRINSSSGVVRKGNPKKVTGLDTICGLRASANLGSLEEASFRKISAACVAAGKPAVEVFTTQEDSAGLLLLANDRADVLLRDTGGASYMATKMLNDIEIAFSAKSQSRVGVGVNKTLPELRQAILDALQILQADGTQKALMTKYGIDPSLQVPSEALTK
jgi:polar amino acid transport system substrate-binding protein